MPVDAAAQSPQLTAQRVVLVAACVGPRCAALRRLRAPDTAAHPTTSENLTPSEQDVHRAVRQRPDAVLVSVPCLGVCEHGSVVVVGDGLAVGGTITWRGHPTMLGLTETPTRSRALADWIAGGAPDPRQRPAGL